MRNPAKIIAIAVILLCVTGSAWAGKSTKSKSRPVPPRPGSPTNYYAKVSAPKSALVFSEVAGAEGKLLRATITAHVTANRPYVLGASFPCLIFVSSQKTIPLSELVVKINGKGVTAAGYAVVQSGAATSSGGLDIPVTIEVSLRNSQMFGAGAYSGSLALAVK
jgi:hypothetical protein